LNGGSEDGLKSVRKELRVELDGIVTESKEQVSKVQVMMDKIFEYIGHLKK
jgi:hypothetical protein